MAIYRIKQFFWAFFSKITEDDIKFINEKLNIDEREYFFRLSKGEVKHCIRIAKAIDENYYEFYKNTDDKNHKKNIVKVALMHDIGKINKRLNIIDKSILVILGKITRNRIKKYSNIKKINVYYNHAAMGEPILRKLNYDEYWIDVIKNHHKHNQVKNKDILVLQHFDNMN
ncbi:HDIG domain-containing protein [Clostridium sp. 19966]|uniref:HDIG domain-containing metalloprotein n=1 Tax=Clostridium sp. 19966 TaxID=2768166 RepID=UPI0028E0483B|nr:HDIG domain-containing metalloprotein [Clostridium sp. 19966]MDT8718880.1 HDIG domain-containing protein [Clostridium sp. 19966]